MWQYHPLLIKLFSISFKTIITQVSLEFNGHLRFVFFQAIPTGRTFKKSEISLKQGGGPILCCHNTFTSICRYTEAQICTIYSPPTFCGELKFQTFFSYFEFLILSCLFSPVPFWFISRSHAKSFDKVYLKKA